MTGAWYAGVGGGDDDSGNHKYKNRMQHNKKWNATMFKSEWEWKGVVKDFPNWNICNIHKSFWMLQMQKLPMRIVLFCQGDISNSIKWANSLNWRIGTNKQREGDLKIYKAGLRQIRDRQSLLCQWQAELQGVWRRKKAWYKKKVRVKVITPKSQFESCNSH